MEWNNLLKATLFLAPVTNLRILATTKSIKIGFLFANHRIMAATLLTLLYQFAALKGIEIPAKTDQLFPTIALNHVGGIGAIVFILGINNRIYIFIIKLFKPKIFNKVQMILSIKIKTINQLRIL